MAWVQRIEGRRGTRWRVSYRDKRRHLSAGRYDTEAEALHRKQEVETLQAAGVAIRYDTARKAASLGELFRVHLNVDCVHLGKKAFSQRLKTLIRFNDFVRGRAATANPLALNRENLADFYRAELARGVCVNTAAKYISHLHTAWKNVAAEVDDSRIVRSFRPLKIAREVPGLPFAPTFEEMDAFIMSCDHPWDNHTAIVARFTGLRNRQLALLRWGDIDFDRGLMTIRPELGKSSRERRGRRFPISAHLLEEMRQWRPADRGVRPLQNVAAWEAHQPLIHRQVRGATFSERIKTRGWKERWYATGAVKSWHNSSFKPLHAFRAGVQTDLLSRGAPMVAVSYLVGHNQNLNDHYIDYSRIALERVANMFPAINRMAPKSPEIHQEWSFHCEQSRKNSAPERNRTLSRAVCLKLL